jgi:hypothetical protein
MWVKDGFPFAVMLVAAVLILGLLSLALQRIWDGGGASRGRARSR